MIRTAARPVLASLVLFFAAAPADAATVDAFSSRGGFAEVHLTRFEPTGTDAGGAACGAFTDAFVSAHENVTHTRPGSRSLTREIYAGVSITDTCTGAMLLQADAYQSDARLSVRGTVSARVEATLSLHDYVTGTDTPLVVALSFTGAGPVQKAGDYTRVLGDGTVFLSRDRGAARMASVTGALRVFGKDLLAGATVDLAAIAQLSSSTVTITRP